MICPGCNKEVVADSYFCTWCSAFIPNPEKGKKANLFSRWMAWVIDAAILVLLYVLAIVFGVVSGSGAVLMFSVLLILAYIVWFWMLLAQGMTPGKKFLGLRVVSQAGEKPGLGKMLLREIIGRFLSGLIFGLGYLWALFDKNSQAWHDKLAGTVVVTIR